MSKLKPSSASVSSFIYACNTRNNNIIQTVASAGMLSTIGFPTNFAN